MVALVKPNHSPALGGQRIDGRLDGFAGTYEDLIRKVLLRVLDAVELV